MSRHEDDLLALSRPRSFERGHSLVEVTIASLLLVVVLGMMQRGVVAVHTASRVNDAATAAMARRFDVVEKIRTELQRTAIDRVSLENQGRTVRFQHLLGADLLGSEVSGRWSSDIEISLDPNGNLLRRQDGRTVVLAMDVEDFEVSRSGIQLVVSCTVDDETARSTVAPPN